MSWRQLAKTLKRLKIESMVCTGYEITSLIA